MMQLTLALTTGDGITCRKGGSEEIGSSPEQHRKEHIMDNILRRPSAARTAAQLATGAFALTILLQVLIALGVLPVTMAWGGTQPVLTTSLRLAGLLAAVVIALSAYIIRRRAGLVGAGRPGRVVWALAWFITCYLFVNTVLNLLSGSMGERLVFAPLSLAEAILSLIVSLSPATE
jgi:hypothetical protein